MQDPLSFPPRHLCSWNNRFDDPHRVFRTLYCAEQRITCLRETIQDLRPDARALADFSATVGAGDPGPGGLLLAGVVSVAWRQQNVLASARLHLEAELYHLDDVSLRQRLERELARELAELGLEHLDIAQVRGKRRVITQKISHLLHEEGAAGIVYRSNLDSGRCVAIFESRAHLQPAGTPRPLTHAVPELLQVSDEFNLVLRHPKRR